MAGVSALTAAAATGATIARRYADRLTQPPTEDPEAPAREADRVTLVVVGDDHAVVTGPGAGRPGVWGVVTATGLGRLGPIRARTPAGIRRDLHVLHGTVTAAHGALVSDVHGPDATALHPDGTEVDVASPIGPLPAHHVPGDDLWAIGVHGRGGVRHETFRMLGPIVAAGHSALAMAYRNDTDAPTSPDGRTHLGATEWRDVAAAMDHARVHGARRLVLIGCSMGGAIVGQALRHAPADDVVGVLLDAPVVDWNPVALAAARDLGLPRAAVHLLMPPTRLMARLRHDVDLATLRLDPDLLTVPTLLVHGSDDEVVPVTGSDALAAARPDLVMSLRVPGAGHVRSWNRDPAGYDAAIRTWLRGL